MDDKFQKAEKNIRMAEAANIDEQLEKEITKDKSAAAEQEIEKDEPERNDSN